MATPILKISGMAFPFVKKHWAKAVAGGFVATEIWDNLDSLLGGELDSLNEENTQANREALQESVLDFISAVKAGEIRVANKFLREDNPAVPTHLIVPLSNMTGGNSDEKPILVDRIYWKGFVDTVKRNIRTANFRSNTRRGFFGFNRRRN
tara:strand:+ start:884 stop:1336 length:453 start_codon:yes stop_codon:yes gene_type:complete